MKSTQYRPEAPASSVATSIYQDGTYLRNNDSWHVEHSSWKASHIKAILSRNAVRPMSICEVGCGAGEVLKQVSDRIPNATCIGYELSPQAFELCKVRQSEKVSYHLKNILNEEAFFDCLLCIDVFEHVEDYMGFLRALKPKAYHKVFHIPLDMSVWGILRSSMMSSRRIVGHLHYFYRDTALATLADCGYEIVDSFYTKALDDFPATTLRAKIMRYPRRLLFAIAPDLAVRLMGGYSLIVLAR